MRLGVLVRSDRTGLAVQTQAVARNLGAAVVLVVDMSRYGFTPEPYRVAPGTATAMWAPSREVHEGHAIEPDDMLEAFLERVDVVYTAETPYSYWLLTRAREKGVRTVIHVNPEFCDWAMFPDLPRPDLVALPTRWLEGEVRAAVAPAEARVLPMPVDFAHFGRPGRLLSDGLRTVLHTAGNMAMWDRNGTEALVEAMRLVRAPVRARIRAIPHLAPLNLPANVEVLSGGVADPVDLYGDEDLFVLPRRYGGLCLPVPEAMAAGMAPVMTACLPQSGWLPPDLLVPVQQTRSLQTRLLLPVYDPDPRAIAERIDWFYEHPEALRWCQEWARQRAQDWSWEALRPCWDDALAL